MPTHQISRRDFLRWTAISISAAALSACAPQTPAREVAVKDPESKTVEEAEFEKDRGEESSEIKPAGEKDSASGEEPQEELPEPEPTKAAQPDSDALARMPFLMPIEDIFSIKGRGTLVTGTVERGMLENNSEVEILGVSEEVLKITVVGIERIKKLEDTALPGQTVGLLLRGVNRQDLQVGQVVAEPGSIEAYEAFHTEIRLLSGEEGGLKKPIFDGYRPQIRVWTLVTTGEFRLLDGQEQILPGETAMVRIRLIVPAALELGTEFSILESGRLVGSGVVTSLGL